MLAFLWGAVAVSAVWAVWVSLAKPRRMAAPPETEMTIPKPEMITPEVFEQLLQTRKDDLFIMDVRGSKEYKSGHKLENSVNIPVAFIEFKIKTIPRDKTVVVTCASGNRSLTGAALLLMENYPKVYTLEGGINGWLAYKKIPRQQACDTHEH